VPFGVAGKNASAAAVLITPARSVTVSSGMLPSPQRQPVLDEHWSPTQQQLQLAHAPQPDAFQPRSPSASSPQSPAAPAVPLLDSPPGARASTSSPAAAAAAATDPAAEPSGDQRAAAEPQTETVASGWVVKKHRGSLLGGQAWRYILPAVTPHAGPAAERGSRVVCGFMAESRDADTAKLLFDWTRSQNLRFELTEDGRAGGTPAAPAAAVTDPLTEGLRAPGPYPVVMQWLTLYAPAADGASEAFAFGAEPERIAWLAQQLLQAGVSFRGFSAAAPPPPRLLAGASPSRPLSAGPHRMHLRHPPSHGGPQRRSSHLLITPQLLQPPPLPPPLRLLQRRERLQQRLRLQRLRPRLLRGVRRWRRGFSAAAVAAAAERDAAVAAALDALRSELAASHASALEAAREEARAAAAAAAGAEAEAARASAGG